MSKYIELDLGDNYKVSIKASDISSFQHDTLYTRNSVVVTTNGKVLYVMESYDQIKALLKGEAL